MSPPTRRAALAVGVAVLLVTAGCLGGTDPTETSTSATSEVGGDDGTPCTYDTSAPSTAATGTWSPNASVEQYPPGVAENGSLVNASVLFDAHFDETANQTSELSVAWKGPESDYVRRFVQGPTPTTYYSSFDGKTTGSEEYTSELSVTGSRHYHQYTGENETLYWVGQNARHHGRAWTKEETFDPVNSFQSFLDRGNYTVNGTVERDGRTFVQLTADEGAQLGTLDSFVTYDGTALVTPDGVVHEVEESFGTGANGTVEKRYEGSVTFDSDVDWCGAPSWTGDVPQLSLSIVEDGHAVEIRNTGGTALPANTSFRAEGEDEPVIYSRLPMRSNQNGTVTTEARLEPGEAIYMTADGNGSAASFTLHDEPTRGEHTFAAAGIRGGNESVYFRLLTGVEPPEWEE